MVGKFRIFGLVALAGLLPAGAPAMSAEHSHCHVIAGDKLPADSGGAAGLCSAIEAAVAAAAPNVRFTAQVKVLSRSMLSAALVVNGRPLPEQKFAVTDRDLNENSIKRFAQSLARKVAAAAKA